MYICTSMYCMYVSMYMSMYEYVLYLYLRAYEEIQVQYGTCTVHVRVYLVSIRKLQFDLSLE